MTLVVIDTPEKNAIIDKVLRLQFEKGADFWLDGNNLGLEGKFRWSSTGKPFEFFNWAVDQPDKYEINEHCVHYQEDFKWNDAECTMKMGFICEENSFWRYARHDMEAKKIAIDKLFAKH
ncbi:lectin subunit alpha-like [Musca vetustissima]|uniref:lectin subunit alpha-like n=1 Tax=Musca vetustissima TaxID=27455 RepID=UPI002AB67CB6|nr:lectin subunit alpha-like [Musca vetustissima]